MASPEASKRTTNVVSVLRLRSSFGQLLRNVEDGRQSIVIEKRGRPKAVLIGIRQYVKLAAPEPAVLRLIGAAANKEGTDKLTARKIDQIVKTTRREKRRRS
jgi:prevent-host-death family protein